MTILGPTYLAKYGSLHFLWVPIICHPVVNAFFFPIFNNSYISLINRLWYLWSVASELPSAICPKICNVCHPVALYQPKNILACVADGSVGARNKILAEEPLIPSGEEPGEIPPARKLGFLNVAHFYHVIDLN